VRVPDRDQADLGGAGGQVGVGPLRGLGAVVVHAPRPPQLVADPAEAPQPVGALLAVDVGEDRLAVLHDLDAVQVVEVGRGLVLAPDAEAARGLDGDSLGGDRAGAGRGGPKTTAVGHPHAAVAVAAVAVVLMRDLPALAV